MLAMLDKRIAIKDIEGVYGVKRRTVQYALARARERRNSNPPTPEEQRDIDIEQLLEHARQSQIIMSRLDPVIDHIEIHYEHLAKPFGLLLAGCFQLGGRWTFHEFIRERMDGPLRHPRLGFGTFGDEWENFHARGFAGARSAEEQALTRPMQRALWDLWLDKYGKKIEWALASQHGSIWDEKNGYTPLKDMYMRRDIPYFDGQGYVKLHVGEQTYQLAVAHEFPGSSMYNVVHAQKRASWQRFPNADVIAQADKHQFGVLDTDVYGNEVNVGNRPSTQILLMQIGTAKGGPDPYTIRSWERGFMEWPIVVFWPDEHKMKWTRDINDALFWLGTP